MIKEMKKNWKVDPALHSDRNWRCIFWAFRVLDGDDGVNSASETNIDAEHDDITSNGENRTQNFVLNHEYHVTLDIYMKKPFCAHFCALDRFETLACGHR